jgi:hypothetical protein
MPDFNGKNRAFQVTDKYYGEFVVDFNDIIMRHQQDQYDHLRYHEEDEDRNLSMALLFLSGVSLDALAEAGVPEGFLDVPTPTTVVTYNQDLINRFEKQFDE